MSAMLCASAGGGACRWVLSASVGRGEGVRTSMPKEWGATGARLPFSVEVDVRPTLAAEPEDERVGKAFALEPQQASVSVTGFGGAMCSPVRAGGWRIDGEVLRFWLDFPEGCLRSDPAGGESTITHACARKHVCVHAYIER